MSSQSENIPVIHPVDAMSKALFCRACARYVTGVTIVTVLGPHGAPHGMTANSFTSVSLSPPLVLVAIDHNTRMVGYLRAANHFGVSILGESQQALSTHFARPGQDRFASLSWEPGTTGVPLIPGSLAEIECTLKQMVEAGDHTLFIGEVVRAVSREGKPLVYFGSRYYGLR